MVLVKFNNFFIQKNEMEPLFLTLHKTQLQMHERLQYKTRYPESDENEVKSLLDLIGTGQFILNRILVIQA